MTNNGPLPECPECGCNAVDLIDAGSHYGRPWVRLQCDYCEHTWRVGSRPRQLPDSDFVDCVPFQPVRCPRCHTKAPVSRTVNERIRLHKCPNKQCNHTFKSIEVEKAR